MKLKFPQITTRVIARNYFFIISTQVVDSLNNKLLKGPWQERVYRNDASVQPTDRSQETTTGEMYNKKEA